MCFRPAETELPPVACPNCGKQINRIAGQLPSKCPFCKTSTEGIENAAASSAAPSAAPGASQAPSAPAAPKAPATPSAPAAPKAPTPPSA